MENTTTLVRLEKRLISAVKQDASSALHQDVPYGRAVAWLHGEYRRLKKLEKAVAPDLTRVSLTAAGEAAVD